MVKRTDPEERFILKVFDEDEKAISGFNFEKQKRSVMNRIDQVSVSSVTSLHKAVWGLSLGLAASFLFLLILLNSPIIPQKMDNMMYGESVEMFADLDFYENLDAISSLTEHSDDGVDS